MSTSPPATRALITTLDQAGITSPDTIGAVLFYRIITFKIGVTLV
jgi:hypothetical protein